MHLADFILTLLKQQGVKHIFGVPGDYNLKFLDYIEADKDLQWIGNCNELNAAYAADGYAREKGFGVLVTTHGVGELSTVNGIAGSYAENVPVLEIVGYPSTTSLEHELPIHHTLAHGDRSSFLSVFDTISCTRAILSEHNYIDKLTTTIARMLAERKPAILALPLDLLSLNVSAQVDAITVLPLSLNTAIPQTLIDKFSQMYKQAQYPVVLIGDDVKAFHWQTIVKKFIDKLNLPFASIFMGKSVINEQDPHCIGVYGGAVSYPEATKMYVEKSDCIIAIGTRKTDFTTGGFSDKYLHQENQLAIKPTYVRLGKQYYKNLDVTLLLETLIDLLPSKKNFPDLSFTMPPDKDKWDQSHFWPYIARHVIQANDIVAAEAGTSLFGLLWQRLPDHVTFLAQILWASIGYTLPAIIGAVLSKPQHRGLLFIGDGSFLLTAQELSTIVRYRLNITVFLINNEGYTIERAIHGETQPYNDIAKWDFVEFAKSVGVAQIAKIKSFKDLRDLENLLKTSGPKLIECVFARNDVPELLAQTAKAMQTQNT